MYEGQPGRDVRRHHPERAVGQRPVPGPHVGEGANAELHLDVELAVLLPRVVVPHHVHVVRHRRQRVDLLEHPLLVPPAPKLPHHFFYSIRVIVHLAGALVNLAKTAPPNLGKPEKVVVKRPRLLAAPAGAGGGAAREGLSREQVPGHAPVLRAHPHPLVPPRRPLVRRREREPPCVILAGRSHNGVAQLPRLRTEDRARHVGGEGGGRGPPLGNVAPGGQRRGGGVLVHGHRARGAEPGGGPQPGGGVQGGLARPPSVAEGGEPGALVEEARLGEGGAEEVGPWGAGQEVVEGIPSLPCTGALGSL
eukprot:CAMPEP_0169448810 /NCGR_PEP_ID=MMETSP1042-20121227/12265_1 /TAXON_ID=464988 /ORGANISM="Hemiselmis andersenii, Strain CCMP1180" /LENGTH=306 /DNA_ID=CAMNT_0009560485 /DNA_START=266 /DNA_END=1186 /DNA_ORIENTATION=+